MQALTTSWQENTAVHAILSYIEWYRRKYQIKIGSVHCGGDDLSARGELLEQLARAEFGQPPWPDLADDQTRDEMFAYVSARVSWLHSHGIVVPSWPLQPSKHRQRRIRRKNAVTR